MGRLLAIDFGLKRSGIAVTDELQLIASGLTVVKTEELLAFLREYTITETVDKVIIGLPKQMDNTPSESEVYIIEFIKALSKSLPDLTIEREDERFTSKLAFQTMLDSGMGKKKRQNKSTLDEISATLILQSYMASNS
jgi:putative Holliday junction resolvase